MQQRNKPSPAADVTMTGCTVLQVWFPRTHLAKQGRRCQSGLAHTSTSDVRVLNSWAWALQGVSCGVYVCSVYSIHLEGGSLLMRGFQRNACCSWRLLHMVGPPCSQHWPCCPVCDSFCVLCCRVCWAGGRVSSWAGVGVTLAIRTFMLQYMSCNTSRSRVDHDKHHRLFHNRMLRIEQVCC